MKTTRTPVLFAPFALTLVACATPAPGGSDASVSDGATLGDAVATADATGTTADAARVAGYTIPSANNYTFFSYGSASSGTEFDRNCATNSLIVGVQGLTNADGLVAIAERCAPLLPDGTVGPVVAPSGTLPGGTGGTPFTIDCPAATPAVIGLRGLYSSTRVTQVQLHCGAVPTWVHAGSPGPDSVTAGPGAGAMPWDSPCFLGQVMTHLGGRASDTIDALGGGCGRVAPPSVSQFSILPGHLQELGSYGMFEYQLGTDFMVQCPAGEVIVGIDGRESTRIDALAPRCARLALDGTLSGVHTMGALVGGSTGTAFTSDCPANTFVSAYAGTYDQGVNQLQLSCTTASTYLLQPSAGGTPVTAHGTATGSRIGGDCPQGYALTGLIGRADDRIRVLSSLCDPIASAP